jgi:hypothetical protein
VDEHDILGRIDALVAEEHKLRSSGGNLEADDRRQRLQQLEETLDQCWDLLRQRRARVQAGKNPDEARTRPVGEVEGYLQ